MIHAQQPGGFSDVTYHGGAPHVVRPADGQLHVDRFADGAFTPVASFPCGGVGFARILSTAVGLCVIYRPEDGLSVIWRNLSVPCIVCAGAGTVQNPAQPEGPRIPCPVCEGGGVETRIYPVRFGANWPCALGANGYVVNDLHGGETGCRSYQLDGQDAHAVPALPGTGIARLDDQNYAVSNDANRYDQFSEWNLQNPQYSPRVFVGENQEGGVACVLDNAIKTVLNIYTETFEPKVAKHPKQDEWAIVTTGKGYATMLLWVVTPVDLGAEAPVDPPVDPPTQPPSEPVTVLTPGLYRVSAR